MASEYIGVNRGTSLGLVPGDLTISQTTTGSTDVELRIDLTKNWKRAEIAQFLEILRNIFASPAKQTGIVTTPDL